MDLNLTVFKTDFDPHKRGQQCIRTIKGIEENNTPDRKKELIGNGKLCSENQKILLQFAASLIDRIELKDLSIASFEKNLSEAWNFNLFLNGTIVTKAKQEDINAWWQFALNRYKKGEISHATLGKYRDCIVYFFKWLDKIPIRTKKEHPLFESIALPKKPKIVHDNARPSQVDVKRLVDAVHIDGKHCTTRDAAILALLNDCGARIGEVLSIRNKDIHQERNFLVVHLPKSKTMPRTIISFLAKPYIEQWARISPNKDKGKDAYFFCQYDGRNNGAPVNYCCIKKSFKRALVQTGISWRQGKSLHYFRSLFSTRAKNFGYAQKHAWLGWVFKDHEQSYTELNYEDLIEPYFEMIEKEQNPFIPENEPLLWQTKETIKGEKFLEFLKSQANNPEFLNKLAEVFDSTGKITEVIKIIKA